MVVASPIPGFKDTAAGDDSDNAVETDLAADSGRVADDQQVGSNLLLISIAAKAGFTKLEKEQWLYYAV